MAYSYETWVGGYGTKNSWYVVSLSLGNHSIGCWWIYKIKYQSNGSVKRQKACLVAKCYTQQGLDYFDTLSSGKNSHYYSLVGSCGMSKYALSVARC